MAGIEKTGGGLGGSKKVRFGGGFQGGVPGGVSGGVFAGGLPGGYINPIPPPGNPPVPGGPNPPFPRQPRAIGPSGGLGPVFGPMGGGVGKAPTARFARAVQGRGVGRRAFSSKIA